MLAAIVLCCVMIGGANLQAGGKQATINSTGPLAAMADEDPGAQIKLALWCEQRSLTGERLAHLARAVSLDPRNALRAVSWDWSSSRASGSARTR